jgi:hypothetical protein
MTTKELIEAEIDKLSEGDLEQLYQLIKEFTQDRPRNGKQTFMSKLLEVRIDAPEDFAANLDAYVNGEKKLDEGAN